jgi:hypothetical protein
MRALYLAVFLLIGCVLVVVAAEEKLRLFAGLQKQDVIEVRMATSCCLPLDATYLLRFEGAPHTQVVVTELEHGALQGGTLVVDTNRIDLGHLRLTEADLAGLDRLIEFYHTKHDNICTVNDRIKIIEERDGKVIATEEFTDNACSILETNYMTFHTIIGRLRKEKGMTP